MATWHACQGPTYSQIWRTCTDHLSYNGTPKPIHVRPCSQCTANPYGKSVPGCTDQNFGAKVANSWANLDCWLPHFWRSSLLKFWLTCVKDEQLVIRSTDNIQVYPSLSWIYVATKKHSNSLAHVWYLTIWLFGLKLQQSGTFRIPTHGDISFLEGIDIHNPIATSKNSMQSCISAQFLVYSLVMSSRPNDKQSAEEDAVGLLQTLKEYEPVMFSLESSTWKTPGSIGMKKPNVWNLELAAAILLPTANCKVPSDSAALQSETFPSTSLSVPKNAKAGDPWYVVLQWKNWKHCPFLCVPLSWLFLHIFCRHRHWAQYSDYLKIYAFSTQFTVNKPHFWSLGHIPFRYIQLFLPRLIFIRYINCP